MVFICQDMKSATTSIDRIHANLPSRNSTQHSHEPALLPPTTALKIEGTNPSPTRALRTFFAPLQSKPIFPIALTPSSSNTPSRFPAEKADPNTIFPKVPSFPPPSPKPHTPQPALHTRSYRISEDNHRRPGATNGNHPMNPSEIGNPDYFHKVVDCQWACPAHTNVPEYIRLIAQGRYTDAYMLNRECERLSRHSGPHLRPPLRARLPPRTPPDGQSKTRRHLPPETRRGRPARRHRRSPAAASPRKRTANASPASARDPPP